MQGFRIIKSVFSHFADALAADILLAEGNQTPGGAAENAGRLKLLQHDSVAFHEDFQFIPLGDVQGAADLNGQDNAAQIVNFSNNTSRLHMVFPLTATVAFATT